MDHLTPTPRRRPGIRVKVGHDVAEVIGDAGERLGALDPVAAQLWELCDGRTSLHDLVHGLVVRSAGPPDEAAQRAEAALARLVSARLLQWDWREQDRTIDLSSLGARVRDPGTS